jgi:hypothetical protein
MTNKEILSRISIEFDNGNICFNTEEGLIAVPIHEVLKQNYNDILLSLGRTFSEISLQATRADNNVSPIYCGANKHRFINDIAASAIIIALKEELAQTKNILSYKEEYIKKLENEVSWANFK